MSAKSERAAAPRGPATAEGVRFPEGHTASTLFYEILREAVDRYPDVLGPAELPPDARTFRKTYADALVRFEAYRASSPRRSEIARDIVRATASRLRFGTGQADRPLDEYFARPADPLPVETLTLGPPTRLTPRVPWEGRTYTGKELHALADTFLERHLMTRAAADALRWISDHARATGGIDLSGHKFAVLGASAELAATRLLLEAGASVLWIDLTEPPAALRANEEQLGGSLTHVREGADLLLQPREIARTIADFAGSDAAHLALYAYAAGHGSEWRLAAAMNGIVRCLDPDIVRSVTLLVSPTSTAVVQPEDRDAASHHPARWWQSLLERAGRLPPSRFATGGVELIRAIVPIQGVGYQAAQHIEKMLTAESLVSYGTRLDGETRSSVDVSANVAGISRTRSLSHAVFDAAYLGAPLFGVTTFDPTTTRWLSGLLALHDLLNPDAPGSATRPSSEDATRAAALFAQQVHGGIYALPWALEPCITFAAVVGFARRPPLLWRVIRGRA
ncbi:MAG: hypothetical protein V3V67_13275 [Myxococcota bacterium]